MGGGGLARGFRLSQGERMPSAPLVGLLEAILPGLGSWVLGFVSLLMDISSEMIHRLLPFGMVTILGTRTMAVGLGEGLTSLWRWSARSF